MGLKEKTRGNFRDESETWKHRYITYELPEFIHRRAVPATVREHNKKDAFILLVKNFTAKINSALILPVRLKFYRQNNSRSYSAGKT